MPGKCEAEMGALKTGVEDKNPFLIYAYPVLEWSRLIRTSLSRRTDQDATTDMIKKKTTLRALFQKQKNRPLLVVQHGRASRRIERSKD